ncbi:MAG TPA: SGNH/GDSL hydrolase family protein [Jatrophihabitantaceae bacterium]
MRRLAAAVAAVTVSAATLIAAVALPTGAGAAGLNYVAMGDSYSAASGNLPLDRTAAPECLRSTKNYPHLIAKAIGAHLTDVTCGGAETKDYATAQYNGVPPQLDALGTATQLVTMTIGGNDSGLFINVILDCGSLGLATLGTGAPCLKKYGSSFDDTINNVTYPALVNALQAVKAKAPNATVAILGYPWIMPPTTGCYPQMPLAKGDVPYVYNIQATLNNAVQRAAAATGAVYVDFGTVSTGHDACKRAGVRWVEPVLAGTNPVIIHPNTLGEKKMAAQTLSVLGLG